MRVFKKYYFGADLIEVELFQDYIVMTLSIDMQQVYTINVIFRQQTFDRQAFNLCFSDKVCLFF